eukprot:TRINITY_DN77735_c0_g1_i1.p1 TRINITY_DN77735_c0_g1~~TRINITY_DN77735_c0_g1_i1.p1  ORF type:complete len:223 (+),score=61.15 TRINITY_DN77735_c0_g1_i1:106-774(+)
MALQRYLLILATLLTTCQATKLQKLASAKLQQSGEARLRNDTEANKTEVNETENKGTEVDETESKETEVNNTDENTERSNESDEFDFETAIKDINDLQEEINESKLRMADLEESHDQSVQDYIKVQKEVKESDISGRIALQRKKLEEAKQEARAAGKIEDSNWEEEKNLSAIVEERLATYHEAVNRTKELEAKAKELQRKLNDLKEAKHAEAMTDRIGEMFR